MTKTSFLLRTLALIVLLVLAGFVFLPKEQPMLGEEGGTLTEKPQETTPEARSKSDYVWVDYYKLREGRYWVKIVKGGEALYWAFGIPGTNKIREVRSGVLPSEEITQLLGLLREKNFFQMKSRAPFLEEGIIYEGDLLTVFGHVQGRSHTVSCRPPGYCPEGLMGIVKAVEKKIPRLSPERRDRAFIRAVEVDEARAERLKHRGYQFVSFTEQQLKKHSIIREAIDNIYEFISVEPEEIQKDLKNYSLFSVSGKNFSIEYYYFR